MLFNKKTEGALSAFESRDRQRFEELFFTLSGEPYSLRRRDLLSHASELVDAERLAALLWLWDSDLHVLALNAYYSNQTDEDVPPELVGALAKLRIETPANTHTECPGNSQSFMLGKDAQPGLSAWARRHGFAIHELVLPVNGRADATGDLQTVAFLQVLSSDPVKPKAAAELEILCAGIAVLLSRSRDDRKLKVVERLMKNQAERSTAEWLDLAAETLVEITHATSAIVFRKTPDGFKAVATKGTYKIESPLIASEDSVVNHTARLQKPVRLLDFNDDAARLRAFGSAVHDRELHKIMTSELLRDEVRSVLLAPVIFQKHTLAVIALVNKMPNVHLARVFSKTDEEVLNTVTGFLAGVLPSIEMSDALRKMAGVVSTKVLDDREESEKLFTLFTEIIPSTTGLGVILRRTGESAPSVHLLGGALWTTESTELLRYRDNLAPVPSMSNNSRRHFITRTIATRTDPSCLVVELASPTITGYEHQFLNFFCKELSHVIISEQDYARVVEQFTQLRHAIRSGLTGVVGYVHEALGCFEIYRELDYAPSVLSQGRFRKSLERANFAAARSQHLLEESRFLIGRITHSALRLSSYSLPITVKTVLDTLRPYANERELTIDVQNRLHDETAVYDRGLIEMMLFNIVDNAIKYSFRKRPINIVLDQVKKMWRFSVTDYGTRIMPEDREVIFRPFTRRPTGQDADKRPGTGLGLAVSRDIARAHRGEINYESDPQSDNSAETTFVITIPRLPTESP